MKRDGNARKKGAPSRDSMPDYRKIMHCLVSFAADATEGKLHGFPKRTGRRHSQEKTHREKNASSAVTVSFDGTEQVRRFPGLLAAGGAEDDERPTGMPIVTVSITVSGLVSGAMRVFALRPRGSREGHA